MPEGFLSLIDRKQIECVESATGFSVKPLFNLLKSRKHRTWMKTRQVGFCFFFSIQRKRTDKRMSSCGCSFTGSYRNGNARLTIPSLIGHQQPNLSMW